ncbi:LamG domain-containing protein [bacterium]|nr:LamG domain-containing protein [bacterium]MBU1072942.1 LamG domain-containing protein [bacterium]MBU1676177.1 LamG domain-containing protein [bacterium]
MRTAGWIGLGAAMVLGLAAGGTWAQSGYALEFDGIDDRVTVSDPVNATGPLTLEAWIRPDAFDGGRILSNRDAANGYEIDINSLGSLRFTINGGARGMLDISQYLGQWVHLAVTWEGPAGGDIDIYANGEAEAAYYYTGTMSDATGSLAIGISGWGTYPFDGAIDEIRVFDTVVGQEAIRTWMTRRIGPGHPDYAHLQGAWSFEEGSGQVAAGSVLGRDGQLGNETGTDAADPAWIGSGMVGTTRSTWGGVKEIYRP